MSYRLRLSLPCRILQVFELANTSTFAALHITHCFPAPKSQGVSWIHFHLPLRESLGFVPVSISLSKKTQRANTGGSLLGHSIFVNRDVLGQGMIRSRQGDVVH
jgi:hypothetical protein